MAGKITGLQIFKEKGQPGIPVDSCRFIEGRGIEGDRHADGGECQVTLLAAEVRQWMEEQKQPGLCFRRYKANLETEGLDTEALRPGVEVTAGTARLRVTKAAKVCFPECPLFQQGKECRLSSGGTCLKVTGSGEVSKNDKIQIGGVLREAIREG